MQKYTEIIEDTAYIDAIVVYDIPDNFHKGARDTFGGIANNIIEIPLHKRFHVYIKGGARPVNMQYSTLCIPGDARRRAKHCV